MAAATTLCRHAALLGATFCQSSASVLVTSKDDGVQLYSLEQRQLGSLTLGSHSGLEFEVASVHHSGVAAQPSGEQRHSSVVVSIVHDRTARSHTLCISYLGSRARPISDAPSRLTLPGPAHSCHVLARHHKQPDAATGEVAAPQLAAVVVLADGRIGVTDLGPDSLAGPLHLSPPASQPAPRHVLATSSPDTLLVATQSAAGSPVTLRVLRLPSGTADSAAGGGLSQVKAVTLQCPGSGPAVAHALPTGLTMSPAYALLQWSNGHATAVHGVSGGAAAAPLRPCTFPLADAVLANGASSSAAAPSATPAVTASGRKRKNSAVAGGAAAAAGRWPRVLCAAVDERQFVVLDLESAAAQSQVCYSLHDSQFGCPLCSGAIDVDAALLGLDATQCAVVAAGPEAVLVRLGNAVHVVRLQTQPISLLSLIARLSVSVAAAAGAKPKSDRIGGTNVAKALVTLPAPISLDQALLSGRAARKAAAAEAAANDDDAQDVLEAVPTTAVHRTHDLCNSLVEQLSAAMASAALPPQALLDSAVSYLAGCRQHGMAVPPQLLSLTARFLATSKQWSQLGNLLQHVPQAGLSGCSDVLVAVAGAQQYSLLSRLATCLDEVEPAALVDVLQLLLAPTTRSNLAARQQHYTVLRASAEARIAEAERALSAAAEPRFLSAAATLPPTASALAVAQCAAAAVDGFSYREVLLHPLLAIPVDAPAVQVTLRRLSAPVTDALLSYLAKWVVKYTSGAIGDAAVYVALPQELLFPYFQQVLEWTRMTIDAHLTRLLMARTVLPALESLEAALNGVVEGTKRLVALRGALEHVNAAAQLPAAHLAVAMQYTAEVLDLRVG